MARLDLITHWPFSIQSVDDGATLSIADFYYVRRQKFSLCIPEAFRVHAFLVDSRCVAPVTGFCTAKVIFLRSGLQCSFDWLK